jgi:S-ribosylhomocysteine lyase
MICGVRALDVNSFQIDHNRLLRGVYVSRKDKLGAETATTFDIRMKLPNKEPAIETAAIHTLEHLLAVYLRGSDWADRLIYIGPMGCRTGFYAVFNGDLAVSDVAGALASAFEFICAFEGEIPAAKAENCGNYLDHNLAMAKWEAEKYVEILHNLSEETTNYSCST